MCQWAVMESTGSDASRDKCVALRDVQAKVPDCGDSRLSHLFKRLIPFHRSGTLALVALCVLAISTIGWTADPFAADDMPSLSGEFAVGKDGRMILLPIEMEGRVLQFLLDTGACRTGFDLSLRDTLGTTVGRQRLQTPAGITNVETFHWPKISLNGQSLKSDLNVVCVDLTDLRQASSKQIDGVLGMDILRSQRLTIDFDRGTLTFMDSLLQPRSRLGTRLALGFFESGVPYLTGSVGDIHPERFLIDTGAQGNSLNPELFDRLVEKQHLRAGGPFSSVTVAGPVQGGRGYLDHLAIGPIHHEGLRMSRVGPSSIGLRYLSRYRVTFDFPDRAVYLRTGADHAKPEPHASCGMSLRWISGNVTVESVKPTSPAARAEIQPSDVLVRIDGKSATEFDQFAMRQLLTYEPGRKVSFRLLRKGREISTELVLEED
ncbi:aspartyl protease family protein [Schlesneria paludicola]|uniref:aspartyl protease family protein n=1 Tax=Schlesneria paludicola TaxID=360056 RepID=UPI00029B55E3|nr:aspartyl protease family protein [Schlesneria paludicola]